MGVFSDFNDLSTPWRFSLDEWKDKINNSGFGSPIHGLKAGYDLTKLGSAYRLKQSINQINDGENPVSSQGIKDTVNAQGNNVADAFKSNWPVLAAWIGGSALGGGSSSAGGVGSVGASEGAAAGEAGAAAGAGAGVGSTLAPVVVTGSSGGGLGAALGGAAAAGAGAASSGGASTSNVGDTLEPVTVTGSSVPEGSSTLDLSTGFGGLGTGLSNLSSGDSTGNSNSDSKGFDWQKLMKSMGQGQQGQQQQQQAPPPQMPRMQTMPGNFLTFNSQQPGLGRVDQTLQPKITPEQAQRKLLLDQSMLRMGFGQ